MSVSRGKSGTGSRSAKNRPDGAEAGGTTTPRKRIRVLLVDDHLLARTTLAAWLVSQGDFNVIGEAADASTAIDLALEHKPDIILFDIDMPGLLAFEAAKTIHTRMEDVKIVFLSAFSHDNYIQQAVAARSRGYLTKAQSPKSIADALRIVESGGVVFAPEIQSRLVVDIDGVHLGESLVSRLKLLSPRELEILRYIANGLSKREIADTIHLSIKTVENHTASLMDKLDIHDRVELTRYAIREGITRP